MNRYLVWPNGDTRESAAKIEAVSPRSAAEVWMEKGEFPISENGYTQKRVTVVEDEEGAIKERFDVFCDVSITFTGHRISDEIS